MMEKISILSLLLVLIISSVHIIDSLVSKKRDVSWNDYIWPDQIYIKAGEDAILHCHNKDITPSFTTWFKLDAGAAIDDEKGIHCMIVTSCRSIEILFNRNTSIQYAYSNPRMLLSGNGSLVIRNIQPDDKGQYKCVSGKSFSDLFMLRVIESKFVRHETKEKSGISDKTDIANITSEKSDILFTLTDEDEKDGDNLIKDKSAKNHSEILKDIERIEKKLNYKTKEDKLTKYKRKKNIPESDNLFGLIISSIILIAVILGINLVLLGMLCTLFLQ